LLAGTAVTWEELDSASDGCSIGDRPSRLERLIA
jgi:hypothetical protein